MLLKRLYAQCTNCKYIVLYIGVASCNTFDATFYSDGLVVGDCMYNEDTELVKCPKCKSPIRTDESNINTNEYDGDYEKLLLSDYVKLLDTDHVKDPNKEYHIRIKILRWYNDRIRDGFDGENQLLMFPKDEEIRKNNLERLIILHKELLANKGYVKTEQKLLLAEFYRELGKFDECITILDDIKDESAKKVIEQTRKACEEKNTYVMKLQV